MELSSTEVNVFFKLSSGKLQRLTEYFYVNGQMRVDEINLNYRAICLTSVVFEILERIVEANTIQCIKRVPLVSDAQQGVVS